MEVDELDPALDHVGARGAEGVVHVGQQLGVDLVLGVEDPHDVAAAGRQGCVEGLRLVLRLVVVDDHPHPGRRAGRGPFGDGGGLGVVVPDDHDDLVVGVARFEQPVDGVLQHRLLVAGRQQQREGQAPLPVGAVEARGGERLRGPPRVHLPPQRERGHPEERQ